eukprot:COSAG02_NODE_53465_length_301_cov_1.529703_1_plen_100_part_11
MRRQLTMRCEAVCNIESKRLDDGTPETAVVVVEYSARRDGFKDLALELHAGQVLWVNGLESIKAKARRWGRSDTASAAQRGTVGNPDAWYFLQLPVETAH